jgi:hypothetical protein
MEMASNWTSSSWETRVEKQKVHTTLPRESQLPVAGKWALARRAGKTREE